MSGSVPDRDFDVAQLVQRIREQVPFRVEQPNPPAITGRSQRSMAVPESLIDNLRSVASRLAALKAEAGHGEPSAASLTLSGKFGALLKRQLYRFLWWQSRQIEVLLNAVTESSYGAVQITEAISTNVTRLASELADLRNSLSESRRQMQESEVRLRQLESAQLRLKAAEIERNVGSKFRRDADELDSLRQELMAVRNHVDSAATCLGEADAAVQEKLSELRRQVADEAERKTQLGARVSQLGLFTQQTRASVSLQERRLSLLIEETRKRLARPGDVAQLQETLQDQTDHKYDLLYLAFEDLFRGSRDEIKKRQSMYLPFLKEHDIGSGAMPILDLGCGRGEWLQLLLENGLQARGVDQSRTMIEECKSCGLEALQGEALSSLSRLPDSCLGAVTSFHMVEHMPFDDVLALIDEMLRVLKPGGVLILETPNPENILVGAYTFYLDPSHLKPLPSPMLRFFVEARGFCDVNVKELNPYHDSVRFPDDGKGFSNRLSDYFYGPQDYVITARKA